MVTVSKGKVTGGTGTAKATTKPSDRKPAKKEAPREVKYPEMRCDMHLRDNDLGPVTVELAKTLLGWEDEEDHKKRVKAATPDIEDEKIVFPKDFFLVNPYNGKKVVVTNNSHNRPFDVKHCESLAQDILNRFWADSGNRWFLKDDTITCNGEAIIIGRTGLVLSGQHRLVALIFADYIRKGKNKEHWDTLWKDEDDVTLEAFINYGISESAKVIRTFDNVKPRTFSDVLFTDPTLTGHLTKDKRLIYTRTTDYAIKFLWERTGEKTDSYAPRRTQSEAMEFLLNHPTLKSCVMGVLDADGWGVKETGKKISNLMSLGDAAGVCYLMACSEHESPETYWGDETRKEGTKPNNCNPTRLTQAIEFFKRLATHEDFAGVRTAFGMLSDVDTGVTGGGHKSEKLAILCHCWDAYLNGESFEGECEKVDSNNKKTTGKILVAETKKDNDRRVITEYPDFGGIDKGPTKPKPPAAKKLKDTDIDAALEEAQAEGSDDASMEDDGIMEEEINEEGDGPTEDELDSINESLSEEDLEDKEAVEKTHKNRQKGVLHHNEKVLRKEKAKDEPKKMTPQNAFDGWDKDSE